MQKIKSAKTGIDQTETVKVKSGIYRDKTMDNESTFFLKLLIGIRYLEEEMVADHFNAIVLFLPGLIKERRYI